MNDDDINMKLELTVGCLMVIAAVVVTVVVAAGAVLLVGHGPEVW